VLGDKIIMFAFLLASGFLIQVCIVQARKFFTVKKSTNF